MLVQLGDNERLRNFCTQCGMLNHEVKDFPLGFDEDGDDPDDHQGDDAPYHGDDEEAPNQ